MILLDTNVVSALMLKQPERHVVQWLDQQDPRQVWLPSVVMFELRFGVAIHPDPRRRSKLEQGLNRLISELIEDRIAPLDGVAAEQAAVLGAQRQTRGCSVDLRDTLIAGIALAYGARLATRNVRHFSDTIISLINPFPPDPNREP